MSFGDQVVALVVVSQAGVPGRFGLKALNSVATRLPGCHFRPVGVTETPDIETDIATETWKLTAPAEAAAPKPDTDIRDEANARLIAESGIIALVVALRT